MRKILGLLLAITLCVGMIIPAAAEPQPAEGLSEAELQTIEQQSQKKKVRTIITTDGEVDDMASIIRWLHYANEFDTQAIILSASRWHYAGGSVRNPDGTVSATRSQYRWCGLRWPIMFLEKYAEVYNNLVVHQPDMPTPEYLKSIYRVGNIKQQGEMTEDTEGSNFIKEIILNNPDGENLVVNIWGGANTLCRALKSIEDEYKGTDEWDALYKKISDEVVAYFITDQDQSTPGSLTSYIRPNWPLMRVFYNNNTYNAVGYSFTSASYFQTGWVNTILKIGSPLGNEYLANGTGWDLRNAAIQQPTHSYYTEPVENKHNYFGDDYPYSTWGESENRGDPGRSNAGWFMSEGDNPAYWFIQDIGLRGGLDHPEWGGWGGRFFRDPNRTNNEYTDSATYTSETVISGMTGTTGRFSLQRWLPDMQSDFSARAQWAIKDKYEDANHNPKSGVMNGLDLNVVPGEEITLNGVAYDPDGDELNYRWYRYAEVDTYGGNPNTNQGKGTFQLATTKDLTYTVPADAKIGDTIHLIFEVKDNAQYYMTAYKRVVLTVGEPDVPDEPDTSKYAIYVTTGETGTFDVSLGKGDKRAASVDISSDDTTIATVSPSSLTKEGAVTVNTLGSGTAYINLTYNYAGGAKVERSVRVMSIDSERYADLGYSKLSPQEAVDLAHENRNPENARYIVTTDNETDDMNSMIRLLLYANDIDIVGIVYSSSVHHWKGDGENLYTSSNATIPMRQYRWMGSAADQVFIEEYRKVLPNLRKHGVGYPDADYLRDMVFEGNVFLTGDMASDTPGSDLIKYTLLDERDDSPVWISAWGGANTIARALKSIEDEFKDDPDWENIKKRVSAKAHIYSISSQDTTDSTYIRPNWPDILLVNNGQFSAVAFGAAASNNTTTAARPFLQSAFMKKYMVGTPSTYMVHYQTYNDGLNMTNLSYDPSTAAEGQNPNGHTEQPMGWGERFITGNTSHSNLSRQGLNSAKPDQPNATGTWVDAPWLKGAKMHRLIDPDDPRWVEWGEPQHEDFGNPKVPTYWGGTKPAAYSFYSEGDSPSYFGLINNGLRSWESPSYGGWGHRFQKSTSPSTPNLWTAASDTVPAGAGGSANWYATSRWVPAMQRDFAVRVAWTAADNFEDANHEPKVEVLSGLDVVAKQGETVTMQGNATDPDDDGLTYKWWQYQEADTYTGAVAITGDDTTTASFIVPENAKIGDTIHVIFEVTDDDAELPLTRYQRVIITVALDKTELNALIAEAKEKNEEDYTSESWGPFTEALEKAESVSVDDNATQAEVDTAAEELRTAMDELELFIDVVSVKIDGAAIQQVRMRNTKQFTATVNPGDATYQSVTWESGNPKIFTVDEDGLVTGLSTGNAKLIVTASNGVTSFIMVQITA